MKNLLERSVTLWKGHIPCHFSVYYLNEPEHFGVRCNHERLKRVPLVLRIPTRSGPMHVWACPLKEIKALSYPRVDPNLMTPEMLSASSVYVHRVEQPSVINVWGVIRDYYGVENFSAPPHHQGILLAARTWFDHGQTGARGMLTHALAAMLYGCDIKTCRNAMSRAGKLIEEIEARVAQDPHRNRAWIAAYVHAL